jgi:LPS-assembly lipoprotein
MRNMLIDSLHPGGPAPSYKYRLNVAIREQDVNLGLQQNSIATRGQVRITVQYFLEDTTTGKTLLKESLRSSTGYDILVDQFGSLIANQNAQQNGLQQIANDMTQHLALYFSQQK